VSSFTGRSATPVGAVAEPGELSLFALGCAVLSLAGALGRARGHLPAPDKTK
jgi:hypothetical protein